MTRLLAGSATNDITPALPCWLAGYEPNRRADRIHSRLAASALAVTSGDATLVLLSVDLIGLGLPDVDEIRRRLRDAPPHALVVACSHTHSGPDTLGIWGPDPMTSGVDPLYREQLIGIAVDSVRQALVARRAATVSFAEGPLDGIARNDRVPHRLDPICRVMAVDSWSGEPLSTVVNFACHPEIMHCTAVSADFVTALRGPAHASKLGVPIFLNGALGGMVTANVPPVPTPVDQERETSRLGARFVESVCDLRASADPSVGAADLTVSVRRLNLAVLNARYLELETRAVVTPRICGGAVETECLHFRLGPSEWVTLPGEPTPDIGDQLRQRMTGEPRFVLGICQDELGYLLTDEDYDSPLFSYETSVCPGPAAARQVVDALTDLMDARACR